MKYEEIYLKGYQTGRDARIRLGEYFRFYKKERPHQSLKYRTPGEAYYAGEVETTGEGMVESLPLNPVRMAGPDLCPQSCPIKGTRMLFLWYAGNCLCSTQ